MTRDAVVAGNFRPGEVLTLRALGALLRVGTMPVREALKPLAGAGLTFFCLAKRK